MLVNIRHLGGYKFPYNKNWLSICSPISLPQCSQCLRERNARQWRNDITMRAEGNRKDGTWIRSHLHLRFSLFIQSPIEVAQRADKRRLIVFTFYTPIHQFEASLLGEQLKCNSSRGVLPYKITVRKSLQPAAISNVYEGISPRHEECNNNAMRRLLER